ncbi:hypothetical protein SAMD00023353_11900010 [Rosellinia necatrix]|uniref:Uncharacterized protein n=1 Tax=Rosellinia necatrix TaxID=77044 RepID=A0A1W2TXD8_ROSNE|nr:hypothetical protein SAMD00023353_11900010 [Rosellinia necatrix]
MDSEGKAMAPPEAIHRKQERDLDEDLSSPRAPLVEEEEEEVMHAVGQAMANMQPNKAFRILVITPPSSAGSAGESAGRLLPRVMAA